MKNLFFLFISLLIIVACGKKKTATVQTNTGMASPHSNVMVAKVNAVSWEVGTEGYSISKTSVFNFSGQNMPSSPFSLISFGLPFTTTLGTSSFGGTTTVTGKYRDTLGIYYTARTGTINITELDTFYLGPKKLKATFSFMTDTIGGKSFNVTNGLVDFRL